MSPQDLFDLRPAEIESYLRSNRWELLREAAHGAIWVSSVDTGRRLDVFVPHERHFGDYERRISDVVETLSQAEHRPQDAILRDLVRASADVIRFRLPYSFADDSVRLDDAMGVFQRARDALRAAAWATVEPKPFFTSRPPLAVESFMDGVRLGQTERGSYVVPVISPLGTVEPAPDELVERTDEPFGRFVNKRLADSLSAVKTALADTRRVNSLTPFGETVVVGVSANLCTAISEMTQIVADRAAELPEAEDGLVTIRFTWSPSRPVSTETPSSFEIAREDAPLLADAATFLKSLTPRPTITITGYVVRLEREEDESDGAIGIKGEIEGAERMVVVRLGPADYARALHAHEQKLAVTCSGILERRGTHSTLEEPIEFHAPEPLF